VIDLFAKVDGKAIAKFGLNEGATNFFSSQELARIEQALGKRITYAYPGDNARNVCEGFAALSGSCGFVGAVGSDKAGALFAENLRNCGVYGFLQEKKGATGKILALVSPGGQRTFCADLGVSTKCSLHDKNAAKQSRMLYVASITSAGKTPVAALAAKYMEEFRKAKKRIAISLESPPMVKKNRGNFLGLVEKYADVLFLNEEEAEALLGAGAEGKLAKLKPKIPIYLKKGKRGSLLFLHGKAHAIEALPAKVMDTTGAGDAYAAGALYGISRGYSPLSSAKIGAHLAARVVGKFGAGVPHSNARMRRAAP
ncbi:MAG: PfkB family carbohydrate kinase, partial [Candidatus Micrarchaeota archaeon]|nr:PfkB family carbohydrate kinase [Candidatus Micrarchaeota archaeon]